MFFYTKRLSIFRDIADLVESLICGASWGKGAVVAFLKFSTGIIEVLNK